jgi:hypothetical protein
MAYPTLGRQSKLQRRNTTLKADYATFQEPALSTGHNFA